MFEDEIKCGYCDAIEEYRKIILQDYNEYTSTADLRCEDSWGSDQILSHIRNCSGHNDFLDELLKDISDEDIYREVNRNYIFTLALLLNKNIHRSPLYQSLWRCMPVLQKTTKNWLTGIFGSEPGRALSECSPLEPALILDFLDCVGKLTFFKILTSPVSDITILLETQEVRSLIETNEILPGSIVDICEVSEAIMRYEKVIIELENYLSLGNPATEKIAMLRPYISISTKSLHNSEYSENKIPNIFFILKAYSEWECPFPTDGREVSLQGSLLSALDSQNFPDHETLLTKTRGYISPDIFRDFLHTACSNDLDMHTESGYSISFQRKSTAKSARK